MSDYPHITSTGPTARHRRLIALFATLAGLALAGFEFATLSARGLSSSSRTPAVDVERLLPRDVLLHVSVPDMSAFRPRASRSRLQRLLDDPALRQVRDRFDRHFEVFTAEVSQRTGLPLDDLLTMPGPVSLSVVPRPASDPALVTCLQFLREDRRTDRLVRNVQSQLDDVGQSVNMVGTTHLWTVSGVDPEGQIVTVAWFVRDGLLVLGNSPEVLEGMLNRWDAGLSSRVESFADNDAWRSIQTRTNGSDRTPLVRWFADVAGLMRQWGTDPSLTPEQYAPQHELIERVLSTASAGGGIDGVGGTVDIATPEFDLVVRTAIECPVPVRGLLRMLTFPAVDQTPPVWVSEEDTCISVNWDLNTTKDVLAEQVDAMAGEGTMKELLFSIDAPFRAATGVDLINEVFTQLNGQTLVVQTNNRVDHIGPLIVGLGVNDPQRARELLEIVMGLPMYLLQPEAIGRSQIYHIPPHTLGNAKTAGIAVIDGYLYWSSDVNHLKRVALGTPADRPLADSADFRSLSHWLPARTSIAAFNHSDRYIDLLISLLTFGPEESLEQHTLQALRRHARQNHRSPMCLYAAPDDRGAQIILFSLTDNTP